MAAGVEALDAGHDVALGLDRTEMIARSGEDALRPFEIAVCPFRTRLTASAAVQVSISTSERTTSAFDETTDVIAVGMGEGYHIDVFRSDPGSGEALAEAPCLRSPPLAGAHAGIDQDELFAGVDQQGARLETEDVERDEMRVEVSLAFFGSHVGSDAVRRQLEEPIAELDDLEGAASEQRLVQCGAASCSS
jgi:hypothetical protein